MSGAVVSPAAQQQMEQEKQVPLPLSSASATEPADRRPSPSLETLLMLPFYPEPESPGQTSSLLRMLPREMRDKIWEWTVRGLLRRGTHRRSSNNSLSAYLFLRESDSDRPRNGRHGYTPFRRFGLAGACRQTRAEFMEALHRVVVFAVKVLDYRTANFLGPPRPFALLDMRFLNDLILDITLQHEVFAVADAEEKRLLPDPVSVKYTASGRLEDAQLVLSASWLTPLPPRVLSLAGMLEAHATRGFPHPHDAGFGLQFDRLMEALAWRRGRLSSLDLKLVLPPEIGAAPASTINAEKGMVAFVSSLRRLRDVKRVVVEVYGYRLFSMAEILVHEAFWQACQDAAVVMRTFGQHADFCDCLECFPVLGSGPRKAIEGEGEEEEEEEEEGFEMESDGEEYELY